MSKRKLLLILTIIFTVLGILWYVKDIFGISPMKDWFKPEPNTKDAPIIDLILEPDHINEGQHQEGIQIKLTISNVNKHNITSVRLSKNDVIIDRLSKDDQTRVSTYVRWNDQGYQDYVLNYPGQYSSMPSTIATSGILQWCPDCFMGESSPYTFTFTVYYSQNNGPIVPTIIKRQINIT